MRTSRTSGAGSPSRFAPVSPDGLRRRLSICRARRMSGRHRPPWWPETEPWPPASRGAGRHGSWGGGPWGRRRPGMAQRLGCSIVIFIAFGAVLMAAVAWAYAGLIGAGSGVGVVVGLAILLLVVLAVVRSARWLRGLTEPVDDLVAAAGRVEAANLRPSRRARSTRGTGAGTGVQPDERPAGGRRARTSRLPGRRDT